VSYIPSLFETESTPRLKLRAAVNITSIQQLF